MSQGANKLQRPFLANSIYCSDPISKEVQVQSASWLGIEVQENLSASVERS